MDDKNFQFNVYSVKNCQGTQNIYMWPMKPTKKKSSNMQLTKPAKLQSEEGQVRPMCDDKKCQSTKY